MQNDDNPGLNVKPAERDELMLPKIPAPSAQGERRQQNRRQSGRQGKYDRRKNRCIHCANFQENGAVPESGFCQHHGIIVVADAFACPDFKGLP